MNFVLRTRDALATYVNAKMVPQWRLDCTPAPNVLNIFFFFFKKKKKKNGMRAKSHEHPPTSVVLTSEETPWYQQIKTSLGVKAASVNNCTQHSCCHSGCSSGGTCFTSGIVLLKMGADLIEKKKMGDNCASQE